MLKKKTHQRISPAFGVGLDDGLDVGFAVG